jgi:hypothetical protein
MADITASNALTQSHAAEAGTGHSLMVEVAKRFKISPLRQMSDMFRLRGGRTQLTGAEYYEFQLYRPDLTLAQKKEYVGETGSFALNLRLSPPNLTNMRNFLADKLGLTTLMGALGLPTTHVQAAFSPHRGFGALPTLRSAADVESFLRTKARFPLFGKPIRGSQAMGSVRILGLEGDMARLANGKTVPLHQLAAEVAANTMFGYIFQDAVTVAPEIAAMNGSQTVSTLRVVTINRNDTPEVLYTCWKLPSPNAMSDNFWQNGSMIALVNANTGVIEQVRLGQAVKTEWLDRHPVTGATLKGQPLPQFDAAVALAKAAHAVVPDNGILGWDIALVPGGVCLIECNENTGHELYQLAADRGILNGTFLPLFDAVAARNARLLAQIAARRTAYQQAKAQF